MSHPLSYDLLNRLAGRTGNLLYSCGVLVEFWNFNVNFWEHTQLLESLAFLYKLVSFQREFTLLSFLFYLFLVIPDHLALLKVLHLVVLLGIPGCWDCTCTTMVEWGRWGGVCAEMGVEHKTPPRTCLSKQVLLFTDLSQWPSDSLRKRFLGGNNRAMWGPEQ